MILLREVKSTDVDALYALAERLNTVNLPADRDRLSRLIERSTASSERLLSIEDREHVFVMVEPKRDLIIGSCLIIAQHGTYKRPAVYFRVNQEQKYSATLGKHFVHQVLQLDFDFHGPSELGGLILDPAWRGHPLKLGKLLSYVRFLYIGMNRSAFRDQLVAELLPPLREDGGSDLWDSLGHNFTGLGYRAADRMSRENIEFVRGLFPMTPLYTCTLPAHVRAQIGQVGRPTRPVAKMLGEIGFRYDDSIDPFDGGPTYKVATDECEAIRRVQAGSWSGALAPERAARGWALLGLGEPDKIDVRFRAALIEYELEGDDRIRGRGVGLERLGLAQGSPVSWLALSGPGLDPLYEPSGVASKSLQESAKEFGASARSEDEAM